MINENSEKNKFLTEAMGELWHSSNTIYKEGYGNNDFYTNDGFFKLFRWIQNQPWIEKFESLKSGHIGLYNHSMINPGNFADSVYAWITFLEEKDYESI